MKVASVKESQKMIYNILKQAKQNNRLSHAYLFYGDKGTGKKEMAIALACMHYCPNGGCLECEVCQNIIDGNHMNVDYIGMQEDKTKISKEQIMDLQEEFSKTSLVEGTRIYIVDGIDTASSQAQNSLLKFIEDPTNLTPTVGIFIATELSNVVSTIQSRCVLEHFEAIPKDKMIELLEEDSIQSLDARLVSCLTNDVDEAKEIINDDSFEYNKNLFLKLIDIRTKKHLALFFLDNQRYYSDPKNLLILLSWMLRFLEDANVAKSGRDGLILSPLYDKIISYSNSSKASMKDQLELILNLFKELNANVSAKNVFFELTEKFI